MKAARSTPAWSLALVVTALGCARGAPAPSSSGERVVRIGYQKYGIVLLLKEQGAFARAQRERGTRVQWVEFASGPPMMEAFAAGQIDLGIAGEVPPVLAQAAGAPIVYIGNEPPSPAGEGLVVKADSPVRSVAELRGRKVALNKGSNVHYFLIRALEEAGLGYADVELVFLPPADARAAFDSGRVAAWAIWDPFYASVELAGGVRLLRDASGLALNPQHYLALRSFASAHGEVVRAFLDEIGRIDAEVGRDPRAAAGFLAQRLGLEEAALERALRRGRFGVVPPDAAMVGNQQAVADTFFRLGLIPRRPAIADAFWR